MYFRRIVDGVDGSIQEGVEPLCLVAHGIVLLQGAVVFRQAVGQVRCEDVFLVGNQRLCPGEIVGLCRDQLVADRRSNALADRGEQRLDVCGIRSGCARRDGLCRRLEGGGDGPVLVIAGGELQGIGDLVLLRLLKRVLERVLRHRDVGGLGRLIVDDRHLIGAGAAEKEEVATDAAGHPTADAERVVSVAAADERLSGGGEHREVTPCRNRFTLKGECHGRSRGVSAAGVLDRHAGHTTTADNGLARRSCPAPLRGGKSHLRFRRPCTPIEDRHFFDGPVGRVERGDGLTEVANLNNRSASEEMVVERDRGCCRGIERRGEVDLHAFRPVAEIDPWRLVLHEEAAVEVGGDRLHTLDEARLQLQGDRCRCQEADADHVLECVAVLDRLPVLLLEGERMAPRVGDRLDLVVERGIGDFHLGFAGAEEGVERVLDILVGGVVLQGGGRGPARAELQSEIAGRGTGIQERLHFADILAGIALGDGDRRCDAAASRERRITLDRDIADVAEARIEIDPPSARRAGVELRGGVRGGVAGATQECIELHSRGDQVCLSVRDILECCIGRA